MQDNILFEIDRIAARMSEQVLLCDWQRSRINGQHFFQEAVLRDLQDELRRLLELHGVETVPQKQLYPELVLPSNSLAMQQQLRGPYQDLPPQIQQIPPNFQASTRTYTQAGALLARYTNTLARLFHLFISGPELASYTQSWPSSSVVSGNSFRRTLDEAHM